MNGRRGTVSLLLVVWFVLPVYIHAAPQGESTTGFYGQDQANRGKAEFAKSCAVCHTIDKPQGDAFVTTPPAPTEAAVFSCVTVVCASPTSPVVNAIQKSFLPLEILLDLNVYSIYFASHGPGSETPADIRPIGSTSIITHYILAHPGKLL